MEDYEEDFHSDDDVLEALRSERTRYSSDDDEDNDVGYLDITESDSFCNSPPEVDSSRRHSSSGYSSNYLDSITGSITTGTRTTSLSYGSNYSVQSPYGSRRSSSNGSNPLTGVRERNPQRVSFSPVIDARFECLSTENVVTTEEKVNDLYHRPPVYMPYIHPDADDCQLENVHEGSLYDFQIRRDSKSSNGSGSTSTENENQTKTLTAGEKLLARRQFHKGNFVRFRYPAQFHEEKDKKKAKQGSFQLPSSLKPSMRYGKEPKVQKSRISRKSSAQWPEPPRYPPKARHTESQCEIIKLVEKMEIGTQSTPEISESSAQAEPTTKESSSQYPRVRKKTISTQTKQKKMKDGSVQNVATTTNKMVETSTRILYFPEMNTQHNWSQTDECVCSCGVVIAKTATEVEGISQSGETCSKVELGESDSEISEPESVKTMDMCTGKVLNTEPALSKE